MNDIRRIMANHTPVDIDPKQIENANALWANFVSGGKYSIYVTCIILIGLAVAFVKFV